MRRKIVAAAAILLGALLTFPAANAAENDVRGPKCVDQTDGVGTYDWNTGVVSLRMRTAEPTCAYATYTAFVLSHDGGTQLATQSLSGTGQTDVVGPFLDFTITGVFEADRVVCVFWTTSIGKRTFDRAPDESCIEMGDVPPSGRKAN